MLFVLDMFWKEVIMAFDSLTEKLQNVFKNLRSKGRLTEEDVKAALKEVKRKPCFRCSNFPRVLLDRLFFSHLGI